ncbi:MAG: 1-acyl-sn-glycerol-3-phosphate acyltransferase [Polyangiaceae bacterium]
MKPRRRAITWLFRRLVLPAYFRDIDVIGAPPAADVRGRLFVSNHVNAILDPILVFATCAPPISPVAKSTLWKVPGLRFLLGVVDSVKIVRRVDEPGKQGGSNDQVFDEVAAWLLGGGNILIFPEGTSHNEPHLVALRSGAARMLERAGELGRLDTVTVQSVTLTFDDREQARSRVLLDYGPAFGAAEIQGGAESFREAFQARIRKDLTDRLIEGRSWSEFTLISRAAEMLANDDGDARLHTWKRHGLTVKALVQDAGLAPSDLDALRAAVTAYFEELERSGLKDEDVVNPPRFSEGLAGKLVKLVALPLAIFGIVAHGPPYVATRYFAGRVKSGDETGTIRMGVALAAHPPWTAVTLIAVWLALPSLWSVAVTALILVSPIATIAWIDTLPEIARGWRRLTSRAALPTLKTRRSEATALLREALSKKQS